MAYTVRWAEQAKKMLTAISDRRVRRLIYNRAARLADDPEKQGKPLTDELSGYRGLRAAGQRYRIIYRIEKDTVLVLIVAVGIRAEGSRKDIYARAEKLLRRGTLESPSESSKGDDLGH